MIGLGELNTQAQKECYNILVVDDEVSVRMTIEEMLKPLNCKIFHAKNGTEGLDIFKTTDIDLVILDILLPGQHGLSVCTEIRNIKGKSDVPLIIMTAIYKKMKYKQQAIEQGADAYIAKPYDMNIFIYHVMRLLKKRKQSLVS